MVIVEFSFELPNQSVHKTMKLQHFRSINCIDEFKIDILHSKLITDLGASVSELTNQYNTSLAAIVNKLNPLITKQVRVNKLPNS